MALQILRRPTHLTPLARLCRFYLRPPSITDQTDSNGNGASIDKREAYHPSNNCLSVPPLFNDEMRSRSDAYDIELIDNDAWEVSSGLAHAWRGLETGGKAKLDEEVLDDEGVCDVTSVNCDPDFDEIDNMRVRGHLFYKLDRGSMEFEEYSFDFHRKKSSKGKEDDSVRNEKKESLRQESKMKEQPSCSRGFEVEKSHQVMLNDRAYTLVGDVSDVKKKIRNPTFNQLTGPYHEPFCLDISITKGSVRACVIHRATSKVVVVAHSISKDLKFDLASTRNAATCASVGKILAQRAIEDDIYDVVYTPRKGEKLEGKLHIVLQSIIDSGVNVKVKLKKRQPRNPGLRYAG